MDLTQRVEDIIAPSLAAMGYGVVRVRLGGKPLVLQIMAERHDEGMMTVDDCADISRAVSALMDVEDPITGRYTLEVSSPGIDRPLTRIADYTRFAGFEARVETKLPVDGRKRFTGRLNGVDGDVVLMAGTDGDARIAYDDIASGKLVLTDELIEATHAKARAAMAAAAARNETRSENHG